MFSLLWPLKGNSGDFFYHVKVMECLGSRGPPVTRLIESFRKFENNFK